MDFNILISELRSSSEHLSSDSADKSLLSSLYCNNACKALQRVTESDSDYDSVITGLWLIVAHFAEQSIYLRPVPALSELCFKLFRQCAKAVLNIQWQNLDEDSSVRQNFLVSLANLHAKLVPFDFPRFQLLETLTENPWTNPTLAKIMGGEVEPSDKQEVRDYIEKEDPIILQLRVDMMLKENCEEYALNLCNSCLMHPELATDLSLRITQLSLLYKMGHEDKLQEECQRLSIQDALRVIKELNASGKQKELYTVLAQTFMVQNWIRPCDTETSKELLRMWIRHQLLVDREHDQFKDSIWAMAKLSHSTEQIVIIIDVLREECGDTFLQLYVDMSIFAVKVDKGQMETSITDDNIEAAAARRADMASVCAKLSCLCHHTSLKVARICALTSFALKPTEDSFKKVGSFYGQGGNCCDKCGKKTGQETGAINPATLYEVERLLNMLRPDYLTPDNPYSHIHMMCRRFLLESVKNAQNTVKKPLSASPGHSDVSITQVEGPGRKKTVVNKASVVFEALSPQDVHSRQMLLTKLRLQNVSTISINPASSGQAQMSHATPILAGNKNKNHAQNLLSQHSGQTSRAQTIQHQQYQNQQELYLQQSLEKHNSTVNLAQAKAPGSHQTPTPAQQQQQVSQIIQSALKRDPNALQQFSKTAPAAVVQAIVNIMKGTNIRPISQAQQLSSAGPQSLPTVSTLLRPPSSSSSSSSSQPQNRQQPAPRKYPRPQLYAQPIIASTAASSSMSLPYSRINAQPPSSVPSQSSSVPSKTIPMPGQLQRSESLNMAKSHIQGVRQFMQSQLSGAPPGQQLSTSAAMSLNSSGSASNALSAVSKRVKTTVELAEQAAIARELKKQQQQQKQSRHTQQVGFSGPQIIGTINMQGDQMAQQHLRQQPLPKQISSNIFASAENGFQSNQMASSASQSVALPSSEELLGSITGIDDTIINDLLQDSGLLANTFPDIEVDISGEDKGRKGLDLMLASNYNQLSTSQSNSRSGQIYLSQQAQSVSKSVLINSSRVPSVSSAISSGQLAQPSHFSNVKTETALSLPQISQMNQQLQPSSISVLPTCQQQQVYSHQTQSSPLINLNAASSQQVSEQIRMNRIKEQMKQENIPGEMCMDASNNATYRCIICSLAFETLDLLREHVRNVCKPGLQSSSVYTSKIEQDKANSARAGLETTTVFQCLRCFELCISEAGIKQHRLTCKRVPTVPSDLKKEAAAAAASKSKSSHRASSSNKQGSVKTDSGVNSRPQSRSNTSILTSSHPQKVSKAALQNLTSGAGVASSLGSGYLQPVKRESQAKTIPTHRQSNTASLGAAPPAINNMLQPLSSTHSPSSSAGRSHSTTATSVSNVAVNSHNSSFQHFQQHSGSTNACSSEGLTISHQNSVLNQKAKSHISQLSLGANVSMSTVQMPAPESKKENHLDSKSTTGASSPSYSEILGSGGGKFYKCNLCSQTLCSSSSFIDHWKECTLKHKSISKKKVQREKAPVEPLSGQVLQNVLDVIESVASGSFGKLDSQLAHESHEEMVKLRDPCCEASPDTVISVEGEALDSEVSWDSRATFDNTTDSEMDKKQCTGAISEPEDMKNGQLKSTLETKYCVPSSGADKGSCEVDSKNKSSKKNLGSDEDESMEDDLSLSGSESGSSALASTREAPPQLRDRKLLKPIQSFINETFISPYQHVSKRMGKVIDENAVSESTTSGAESDEDHLLCRVCKTSFQTKRIMVQHYAGKHLQPYTVKTVSDSSSYFCHLCQKTFSTFMLYMQHVPNHSAIIIQKMRIFTKSLRLSQHSERIASQRGFGKNKSNTSPKLVKALKSKKAATKSAANRIKRQMLMSRHQVSQERLKMLKRQQHPLRLTSSEDDYSSDASNLMFKPKKKPMMMIRGPDGKWVRRKRGRPRKDLLPEDCVPEDQVESEESQQTSIPNTADEGGNSDSTGTVSSLSTCGRKRSGTVDSEVSTITKRRRHLSDSQSLAYQRKDGFLSELDTDSNSTTLSISIQESNKLTVRSLSRTQKERLSSCNLNPSVVLNALNLSNEKFVYGDIGKIPSKPIVANEEISSDSASNSAESAKSVEPSKKSTFLDSYLSYISSYSQQQQKGHSKRERSFSINQPSSLTNHDQVIKSDPASVDNKSKDQSYQEVLLASSQKIPVRRCSVNLGQKISLEDWKHSEVTEQPTETAEDAELTIYKTGQPVVCLERSAEVESCVNSNSMSSGDMDRNTESSSETDVGENIVDDDKVIGESHVDMCSVSPNNSPACATDGITETVMEAKQDNMDSKIYIKFDSETVLETDKVPNSLSASGMEISSVDRKDGINAEATAISESATAAGNVTRNVPDFDKPEECVLKEKSPEKHTNSTGAAEITSPTAAIDDKNQVLIDLTSVDVTSASNLAEASKSPLLCPVVAENEDDDVLILGTSEDEENVQQNLKDMFIVVENDVEDENSSSSDFTEKEAIDASATNIQEKKDEGIKQNNVDKDGKANKYTTSHQMKCSLNITENVKASPETDFEQQVPRELKQGTVFGAIQSCVTGSHEMDMCETTDAGSDYIKTGVENGVAGAAERIDEKMQDVNVISIMGTNSNKISSANEAILCTSELQLLSNSQPATVVAEKDTVSAERDLCSEDNFDGCKETCTSSPLLPSDVTMVKANNDEACETETLAVGKISSSTVNTKVIDLPNKKNDKSGEPSPTCVEQNKKESNPGTVGQQNTIDNCDDDTVNLNKVINEQEKVEGSTKTVDLNSDINDKSEACSGGKEESEKLLPINSPIELRTGDTGQEDECSTSPEQFHNQPSTSDHHHNSPDALQSPNELYQKEQYPASHQVSLSSVKWSQSCSEKNQKSIGEELGMLQDKVSHVLHGHYESNSEISEQKQEEFIVEKDNLDSIIVKEAMQLGRDEKLEVDDACNEEQDQKISITELYSVSGNCNSTKVFDQHKGSTLQEQQCSSFDINEEMQYVVQPCDKETNKNCQASPSLPEHTKNNLNTQEEKPAEGQNKTSIVLEHSKQFNTEKGKHSNTLSFTNNISTEDTVDVNSTPRSCDQGNKRSNKSITEEELQRDEKKNKTTVTAEVKCDNHIGEATTSIRPEEIQFMKEPDKLDISAEKLQENLCDTNKENGTISVNLVVEESKFSKGREVMDNDSKKLQQNMCSTDKEDCPKSVNCVVEEKDSKEDESAQLNLKSFCDVAMEKGLTMASTAGNNQIQGNTFEIEKDRKNKDDGFAFEAKVDNESKAESHNSKHASSEDEKISSGQSSTLVSVHFETEKKKVCYMKNDVNSEKLQNKCESKKANKSGVKTIKNSHLSVAAFIAERLSPSAATSEKCTACEDSSLSDNSAPQIRECLEQESTSSALGLVDYSCSSDDNSRDCEMQPSEIVPNSSPVKSKQSFGETVSDSSALSFDENFPHISNTKAELPTVFVGPPPTDNCKKEKDSRSKENTKAANLVCTDTACGETVSSDKLSVDIDTSCISNEVFPSDQTSQVAMLDRPLSNFIQEMEAEATNPDSKGIRKSDIYSECMNDVENVGEDNLSGEKTSVIALKDCLENSFCKMKDNKKLVDIDSLCVEAPVSLPSEKQVSVSNICVEESWCESNGAKVAKYEPIVECSDPAKSFEDFEMSSLSTKEREVNESTDEGSTASIEHTSKVLNHKGLTGHPEEMKEINSSPKKKVSLDGSTDTDDGDDLSSFELVIEKDTSSRNIVTFPERQRDSPFLLGGASFKREVKLLQGAPHNEEPLEEPKVSAQKQARCKSSPKKILTGAKSLRKDGHNQFVWDVDSDGDCMSHSTKFTPTTKPVDAEARSITTLDGPRKLITAGQISLKRKSMEDSELDAVKRKRQALREKTETAPFTWDLEESGEKPESVLPPGALCKDFVRSRTCLTGEIQPSEGKKGKTNTISVFDIQRPGSLKVVKLPAAEAKSLSSKGSGVKHTLASEDMAKRTPTLTHKARNVKAVDGNIQIDAEISFRRDSFPTTHSPFHKSLEVNTKTASSSGGRGRRKSGSKSISTSSSESTPSPTSETQNGEFTPKRQSSKRSKHCPLKSNKPNTPSVGNSMSRRGRRGGEPHHKAGLVKVRTQANPFQPVTKSSNTASQPDPKTPKTRSSEAAIKAYNQKSLRNRGVNPVLKAKSRVAASSSHGPRHKAKSSVLEQTKKRVKIVKAKKKLGSESKTGAHKTKTVSLSKKSPVTLSRKSNLTLSHKQTTKSSPSNKNVNSSRLKEPSKAILGRPKNSVSKKPTGKISEKKSNSKKL